MRDGGEREVGAGGVGGGGGGGEGQTDRDKQRERKRERETDRQTDRDRETETEKQRQRQQLLPDRSKTTAHSTMSVPGICAVIFFFLFRLSFQYSRSFIIPRQRKNRFPSRAYLTGPDCQHCFTVIVSSIFLQDLHGG